MGTLQVLVVSGSEQVISELADCFKNGQLAAEVVQAKTPNSFQDLCTKNAWDVVILDAGMESLPFQTVLEQAKASNQKCLVYVLLESLDEEAISTAIRMGFTSFILRDRLSRLIPNLQTDIHCLTEEASPEAICLTKAEQILKAFLNESTDSIWVKDRDGRYLLINQAGARFIGKPVEEILGKVDTDLFQPDTAEKIRKSDLAVMQGGSTRTVEDLIVTLDGTARTFQAVKGVFRDEQGEIQGVIGTIRDVTARKQAEEALKYYAARLEHSNRDLEQFAFIASHDLQAPLRKIKIFAEMLQELAGDEGKDTARRLQASVVKMQHFISDLLALSRVSRRGKPFNAVSLNSVINGAIEDVELVIRETKAQITVDELGTVYGDSSQLEQLFQNLLANSLKYRMPDRLPEIRIKGELLLNGFYQVIVQDNGIGFEEQHRERIFRPFERLHSENKYSGTGMGLAICKKIMERHGGQITVNSKPGEGSTFTLYLPTQPTQENLSVQINENWNLGQEESFLSL